MSFTSSAARSPDSRSCSILVTLIIYSPDSPSWSMCARTRASAIYRDPPKTEVRTRRVAGIVGKLRQVIPSYGRFLERSIDFRQRHVIELPFHAL